MPIADLGVSVSQAGRMDVPGQIVILNGTPRSGKSMIVETFQDNMSGTWVNLGVDASTRSIPQKLRPGIGLRPGGERPDLEESVVVLYAALYESIAAHARIGVNVVVDVAHHESYCRPLHILGDCARRLSDLPVLFVGVRCPIDVIRQRREQSWGQNRETADQQLSAAVERWQDAVHVHGSYDLDIDTSVLTSTLCAQILATRLTDGPPGTAFARLAGDH